MKKDIYINNELHNMQALAVDTENGKVVWATPWEEVVFKIDTNDNELEWFVAKQRSEITEEWTEIDNHKIYMQEDLFRNIITKVKEITNAEAHTTRKELESELQDLTGWIMNAFC